MMTIIAAVIYVVRSIYSRKKLEEKPGFVATSSTEIEKGFFWREAF